MPKRMKHGLVRVVKKLEIFRDLTEDEAILGQRKAYDTGDVLWNPGGLRRRHAGADHGKAAREERRR